MKGRGGLRARGVNLRRRRGIQWLRDGLGILFNASESESLARSLESNDGVYFVPRSLG
jgi:glycerol kinase